MILRGSVFLLTEAVAKSNRLVKYLEIFRGGRFYLRRRSQLTGTQNSFMEEGILFTEAVTIDRLGKSIYGGGQKYGLKGLRPTHQPA
jgi:hypothetical protein